MGTNCNMPPIHDDEVIDAAKEEKTEDAVDAGAAEPEAAAAVEEKKEEEAKRIKKIYLDKTAQKSKSKLWCFSLYHKLFTITRRNSLPAEKNQISSKIPTSLGHISIEYF